MLNNIFLLFCIKYIIFYFNLYIKNAFFVYNFHFAEKQTVHI